MLAYQRITKLIRSLKYGRKTFVTSTYKDVEIPRETIAEFFFRYVSVYHDKVAYIDDQRNISYTYSDTKNCINGIASALTKKGVTAGTMVGIIASNSPEYIMLIFALSSMGCSVTICNYNYTKTEMGNQLEDSKPSMIFTDRKNLDKVVQAARSIPEIKEILIIGDRLPPYGSVQDLLEDTGNYSPIGQIDIDIDTHVALMPYSSGTTGLPKGVMLTHRNLVSNMLQMSKAHPVIGPKTLMINLPLYHIYATMIITTMGFTSGSRIIVQPSFEPIPFLKGIETYKASLLHLVPPQILFLLNYPEVPKYDLSSVEKCISAAAPLDAIVENRIIERFRVHQPKFQIYQGYGLSETSPMTHIVPEHTEPKFKQGSIGLLVPNMRCKVVDIITREEVSPNKEGELLLQGPNVMKGYFGNSGATQKAFENDWFLTGDIGRYDDDQYFYIVDRIKELIKVKGLQVAPAELEGVLLSMEGISDCAVIGVPDDKLGEVPKAFVVKSKEITEKEINDFVAEHLSPHKHLKGGIVFIDKIPKSPSGKLLRRLLKQ